ncbi:MAG: hypothetical protein AAF662_02335 [Pseudomonadota bacterium]
MTNLLSQLRRLVPEDVTQVGESQGPNGDGTTDVVLIGGGRVRVTGTGFALGTPVFVRGGLITGQAPSLALTDIIV